MIPFSVPTFHDNEADAAEFPTKLDYLIADLNGDGFIDVQDAVSWYNDILVRERRQKLLEYQPDYNENLPSTTYPPLEKQDWWKENDVQVTTLLGESVVPLTWHKDDWELELVLPDKYWQLQIGLSYLRERQREQEKAFLGLYNTVDTEYNLLMDQGWKLLADTSSYRTLQQRLDTIDRQYLRL